MYCKLSIIFTYWVLTCMHFYNISLEFLFDFNSLLCYKTTYNIMAENFLTSEFLCSVYTIEIYGSKFSHSYR